MIRTGDVAVLNVQTSGTTSSTAMKIKASRKAFEILSSGLYSDKVRACIRELSTNAADAHVDAGKPTVPFEVHLPNTMEPYFAVKDYGTGLSEEKIRSLYTTYFESNKTDSNDFTGALGLGSKSPFCYTDSFTVTSRYNGTLSVYSLHLGEDGCPTVTGLGHTPTTEPNGIEVKFSVKSADNYEFLNKASEVLSYFKVRPTVKGSKQFNFIDVTYKVTGEGYGVTETGNSHVIMGNVAYPLDAYTSGLSGVASQLIRRGIDLFVPIGACDVNAGREGLSYDKPTKKYLEEVIGRIATVLAAEIEKKIEGAASHCEARRIFALNEDTYRLLKPTGKPSWNGKDVGKYIEVPHKKKDGEVTYDITLQNACYRPKSATFENAGTSIGYRDDLKIIYDDLTKPGIKNRVWEFLNELNGGTYYKWNTRNCYLLTASPEAEKWLDDNGLNDFVTKATTLPEPVKAERMKGEARKSFSCYELANAHSRNYMDAWNPKRVNPKDETGYYVVICRGQWQKDGVFNGPRSLGEIVEMVRTLSGKSVQVIGIRPHREEKFKAAGWKNVMELAKETAAAFDAKYRPSVELAAEYYHAYSRWNWTDKKLLSAVKGTSLGDFIAAVNEAQEASQSTDEHVSAWKKLAGLTGVTWNSESSRLSDMQEQVFNEYPMLRCVDSYAHCRDGFVDGVIHYVQAVGKPTAVIKKAI